MFLNIVAHPIAFGAQHKGVAPGRQRLVQRYLRMACQADSPIASFGNFLERAGKAETAPRFAPFSSESWTVHPLGGQFALISRDGSRVSESKLQAISKILNPKPTKTKTPR